MLWQRVGWDGPALCAQENVCTFQQSHMAAGENIALRTDSRPGREAFQSNCCNKLPVNEAALFSRLTPDAECATLFARCTSLLSCFLIPNTAPHHILSTSLAEPCGRHSVAWPRAWKQILAGLCEPWDQSRPTHDLLAHSALLNSGLEELFRPFTEIEEEIPQ